MYISEFQIKSYKSFLSSQEVELTSGFNVVVGQNNAGKTALVEAVSLHFDNKSHISMKTTPNPNISYDPGISGVHLAFRFDEGEVERMLLNAGGTFYLPWREGTDPAGEAAKFLAMLPHAQMLHCV